MLQVLNRSNCMCTKVPAVCVQLKRNKGYKKSVHWSKIEKRDFPRFHALSHFDDFYKTIYGEDLWRSLRVGLLCNNKYCAVVNNYANVHKTMNTLEEQGALNMRQLFEMEKLKLDKQNEANKTEESEEKEDSVYEMDSKIQEAIDASDRRDRISKTYSQYQYVQTVDVGDTKRDEMNEVLAKEEEEKVIVRAQDHLSLQAGLMNASLDVSRIINPKDGSASALFDFVPATKLKGIDVLFDETEKLQYFMQKADFPITVEKETHLNFPEHLQVYTYDKFNVTSFPHPKKDTAVSDFFLLDGGSVIPVLALDLKLGDRLLDMCGAPGGKALTAFQTLMLDKLVCNDRLPSRVNRIRRIMNEYLFFSSDKEKFEITEQDGLKIKDKHVYNKILVDAPCTNDRLSVTKDENNWFMSNRMIERLQLPEMQANLLATALRLVAPGGTVVYSVCSLSPVQGDGVVKMALRQIWSESDSKIVVKNLNEAFRPANSVYHLVEEVGMKYGIVVLPHLSANFGPMYVSKLVKQA